MPPTSPPLMAIDVSALIILILSALGVMPGIAALLAVVWYAIKIYDRFWGPDRPGASDD